MRKIGAKPTESSSFLLCGGAGVVLGNTSVIYVIQLGNELGDSEELPETQYKRMVAAGDGKLWVAVAA